MSAIKSSPASDMRVDTFTVEWTASKFGEYRIKLSKGSDVSTTRDMVCNELGTSKLDEIYVKYPQFWNTCSATNSDTEWYNIVCNNSRLR